MNIDWDTDVNMHSATPYMEKVLHTSLFSFLLPNKVGSSGITWWSLLMETQKRERERQKHLKYPGF